MQLVLVSSKPRNSRYGLKQLKVDLLCSYPALLNQSSNGPECSSNCLNNDTSSLSSFKATLFVLNDAPRKSELQVGVAC